MEKKTFFHLFKWEIFFFIFLNRKKTLERECKRTGTADRKKTISLWCKAALELEHCRLRNVNPRWKLNWDPLMASDPNFGRRPRAEKIPETISRPRYLPSKKAKFSKRPKGKGLSHSSKRNPVLVRSPTAPQVIILVCRPRPRPRPRTPQPVFPGRYEGDRRGSNRPTTHAEWANHRSLNGPTWSPLDPPRVPLWAP